MEPTHQVLSDINARLTALETKVSQQDSQWRKVEAIRSNLKTMASLAQLHALTLQVGEMEEHMRRENESIELFVDFSSFDMILLTRNDVETYVPVTDESGPQQREIEGSDDSSESFSEDCSDLKNMTPRTKEKMEALQLQHELEGKPYKEMEILLRYWGQKRVMCEV
ncbi:hypothetical protein CJ030_MR5G023977 [Morella rubra]|uniref:Uncharacterized protein n=1 Tax=Morella rubra TaxID=262757 RepID=A0A6A1VIK7_9ROSI|nr:hypothetical protein CJ030_MR5G023977 [Morella rubra]